MKPHPKTLSAAGCSIVIVTAFVALSGCATKGFVRNQVADGVAGAKGYTDTQVGAVKTDVDQVRTRADQANQLAERIAAGDYSEVSSHQVQFEFDDYRLSADATSMLDQLAGELASHPHYVLEIRGYCDAKGTDRYNYRLGRERADEVLRYLMTKHAVPTTRATTVSFGEESPLADNTTSDGRAQNRRVQVRLLELKLDTQSPVSSLSQ